MTTSLSTALERLVSRGVLTPEQADAVRSEVAGSGARRVGAGRGRTVAPAVEVAAYLGAALTVVALGFLLADPWSDAPRGVRALLLAVLALVLVGAGFALRDPEGDDPARGRLTGTLWAGAVVAVGWCAGVAVQDGSAEWAAVVVGGAALALAVPLYLLQRYAGQLAAVVASALVVVGGLLAMADASALVSGLVVTAFGLGVLVLGVAGVLDPRWLSVVGGAAIAVVGIEIAASDEARGPMLMAGVALCIGLFALATRAGAALAAVATVGIATIVPQALEHFWGDSVSVPAILLVTGLALLGGAAATNRIRRSDG